MALPIWTVFLATLVIWYFMRKAKKDKLKGLKELPGPKGLPIIGNLLQLGAHPTEQFSKWAEEYGDIFQVKVGHLTTVVVSTAKMSKEMFSGDPAFNGRPQNAEFGMYLDTPRLGFFASDGEKWQVHRRFALRQLRDFGFGKSSMQELIMEELLQVIEMYKKKAGKPTDSISRTLRLATVNSLWTIMGSKRFDHDDARLLNLATNTSEKFNIATGNGGALIALPWLKYIIPNASGYSGLREMFEDNRVMFEKEIEEHKETYREGETRDYIDLYLAEMKKAENDPTSHFHGEIAERNLAVILFDLFFAGSDTTAMTTAWTVLYLCTWPEVQTKLQKEIEEVTGNNRRVTTDDRPNMPYTIALIDEILRYSSIVPTGSPHRAMADREFKGYFIPKDAILQPNLRHMHFNPKVWGDPDNFRPERFLSPDGKKYVKNDNLQAFQIGSRQCLGETLARDTVFLYITNLFQQFSMKFDPNSPHKPTFEPITGLLATPQPFSVIMTNRLEGKL